MQQSCVNESLSLSIADRYFYHPLLQAGAEEGLQINFSSDLRFARQFVRIYVALHSRIRHIRCVGNTYTHLAGREPTNGIDDPTHAVQHKPKCNTRRGHAGVRTHAASICCAFSLLILTTVHNEQLFALLQWRRWCEAFSFAAGITIPLCI